MNATRDVYGFISILSLTWHLKKHEFVKQIYDYVCAKSEKYNSKHAQLLKFLSSSNVGLLVNERLINMPYDVVPELHEQIPEDLRFTMEQDDIENPKEFKYEYLLCVSKFAIPNA